MKHAVRRMAGLVTLGTLAAACAGPPSRATLVAPAPSVEPITPLEAFPATASSKRAVARSAGAENPQIAAQFDAYLAAYPDLTVDGLRRELPLPSRRAEVPLPFDPSQAKYFDLVTTQLQMTQAESGQLRRAGVAVVDHAQAYSMASMYFAVYARDLPVLITADSILHAWHRSYDDILVELETGLFTDTITTVLAATHDELAARAARVGEASVRTSLEDVDLYLTVARTCSTAGVPRGGHRARTRRPQSARPGAFRRSSVRTRRWPSCSGVSRR